MSNTNNTNRVMVSLTDQAVARLDQLVQAKQQLVNQNPELAKYHVRVTRSNIIEELLANADQPSRV